LIKKWRKLLHTWDQPQNDLEKNKESSDEDGDEFMEYDDFDNEGVLIIHEDDDQIL
jgi:hypothetical protein